MEHCKNCTTSACSECQDGYYLFLGVCIEDSSPVPAITTVSLATASVAAGLAAAISIANSGTAGASFWIIFKNMQTIEMLSLLNLRYPNTLMAFFGGFEFSLLNWPEQWNFIKISLDSTDDSQLVHANLEEGGFYTHYFIVQQLTLIFSLIGVALLWLNWVCWLRRCDKSHGPTRYEEAEEAEALEGGEEDMQNENMPTEEDKRVVDVEEEKLSPIKQKRLNLSNINEEEATEGEVSSTRAHFTEPHMENLHTESKINEEQ